MSLKFELLAEAKESLDKKWFIQSIEEEEHTDITLSLRLHIRPGLFVQVFYGERTESLYFALIEGNRRVFGIDRQHEHWHLHPFGATETHQPLDKGLTSKPLLSFLARVEKLLLEQSLL